MFLKHLECLEFTILVRRFIFPWISFDYLFWLYVFAMAFQLFNFKLFV